MDDIALEGKQIAEKHERVLEVNLRQWIAAVLGEKFNSSETLEEQLKSGVRLCKLLNLIKPDLVKKFSESKLPFQQMENVSKYINGCIELGMHESNIFQTVDLYESKNINQVINNLHNLASLASTFPTFKGPHFNSPIKISTPSLPTATSPVSSPTSTPSPTPTPTPAPTPTPTPAPLITSNPNPTVVARPNRASMNSQKPIQFQSSINYLQPAKASPVKVKRANFGSPKTQVNNNENATPQSTPPPMEKNKSVPKIASVASLDNDIATKQLFKYDPEMESAAVEWIESVTKIPISGTINEWLKDGVVLCTLLNCIIPGTIKNINTSKISFKQRENIAQYLKGAETALGLKTTFLFQTVDLYEEKNMNSVITSIHVLAKAAAKLPNYKGPQIRQITAQNNPLFEISTGLKEIVEDSSISDEEQSMVNWINSHLGKRNLKIQRLRSNLRDGVSLINLLEELTGLPYLGVYEKNPNNIWQCMQNAALILQFINQQTGEKVIGCTGPDITTGRFEPILNLCNLIRTKFDREFVFKSQNLTEDTCRVKIIEELIDTERTYVKLMTLLAEKVLDPIRDAGDVPEEEQQNIFSNMRDILEFNKGILKDFERCVADPSQSLSGVFLARNQYVELYSKYVNNFDMASLMVKYNMKKFKSLKKIINKFESDQRESSGLDLSSFLILPVQRLPRYVLLLKELLRYTSNNHPEHNKLNDAINFIANSLETINENKRHHEKNSHKILNIDKSMVYEMEDFEGIVHPKREYLFEGLLRWEEQDEDNPYWFLFNDILVYCAQLLGDDAPPGKQFRYVTLMPLRFIDKITDNPDIDSAFDMLMEEEVITLQAENPEKKEEWKNAVINAKSLGVDLDLVW